MANTIQLKRSSTASDTPSADDLSVGELAVNTADAKLFTKHTDNSIKEITGSGTIASQDADSVNIDGGAIDGVTIGTNSVVTDLRVDNLKIDGNQLSSTGSSGSQRDIYIQPNGGGTLQLMSHNILVGDINTDVTLSSYGTGDLTLNTNSGTNSGSIVIADGANGNISLTPNGTGSVVLDGLSYPQADGNNGQVLTTNGSGTLSFTTVSGGGGGGTIASQDADSVNIDGGAIDAVTLGTNSAITEAQIDLVHIDGFAIDGQAASYGLVLKANGQFVARIQSTSQSAGGGLYLYQNNPYITFEGATGDAYETNLKVTDPTADRDITLPDATGTVALDESTGMTLNNGVIALKNGGTQSEVRLYCESSNAHYAGLKAPAHADFSGNVTSTLPSVTGTLIGTANADAPATTTSSSDADHVLINDGGVLKKITPTNLGIGGGGGSSLTIQDEGSALSTAATTLNFVGAGVAATGTGATKTITIGETSNADTVDNKHVSVLSQSAYNALTPDSNTIYFITG